MAVFVGYFDDSRYSSLNVGGETTITSVAGYVSTAGGWKQFERTWRIFLERHDIEYLHMRELFAFKGQFEKF